MTGIDLTALFLPARDVVAQQASLYGIVTAKPFTVCSRDGRDLPTYLDIEPRPIIDQVNPQMQAAFRDLPSIELELDDIRVQGISRQYSLDQLFGVGKFYVVGLTAAQLTPLTRDRLDEREVVRLGGIVADLVPGTEVEEQNQLHYSMTLRRRRPPEY